MTAAMVDSRLNSDPDVRRLGFKAHDFDTWLGQDENTGLWTCGLYHVWSRWGAWGHGATMSDAITDVLRKFKAAAEPGQAS